MSDAAALAAYLAALDTEDVGVHLGDLPERDVAFEACRLAGKRVVGLDARPSVVVTADGVFENGVTRPLKDEVDAAVPQARRVIVFRVAGDVPLAPTLDAYLTVTMLSGRDVWADQVGASG